MVSPDQPSQMKRNLDFPQSMRAVGTGLFHPRVILFVAFFACYLCAVVDMRLIFQARDELFLWNFRFFTDFVGQPGSLLLWMDSLLVQLCYHGWPGAIALAAVAWLLLVSTIGFMNASGRAVVGGTWVVPGILLMALCSHYDYRMSVIIGLALAMSVANGWVRIPVRWPWLRLALFVTISTALYYVAGWAYYCFAACCVVHEALAEKRRLSWILLLLAGAGVKFGLDAVLAHLELASRNFQVPSLDEYKKVPQIWLVALFYCYFPACAVFVAYRQAAGNAVKKFRQRLQKSEKAVHPERAAGTLGRLRWTVGTVLVLLLAATTGFFALDWTFKAFLEIDYCSEHRQWNDVLVKARNLPIQLYSPVVNHHVNLALYHTRRLPYQMFSYPQGAEWVLFDKGQLPRLSIMIRIPCDLLLELGRVNEAEHMALEMLEARPTGGALQRLALLKMIKGQPDAARLFLNVLQDDLVWGRWAKGYLQRLATDPDLADDEDIQRSRRLMIKEDDLYLIVKMAPDGTLVINFRNMLLSLLKQNSTNRMAFEYLMSACLVTGDLQVAVESFSFLDNISYPAVPTLYEEAALIYGLNHPGEIKETSSGVFFHGRKISELTLNNYHRFQAIVKRYPGPTEEARAAIMRELGGTYFEYFFNTLRR